MRKTFDAAIVCAQYVKIAPTLIHPEALEHSAAYTYRDGIFTICVINPAWGQKIISCAEAIRTTLNKNLKTENIKKVKIKVMDKINIEMRE